MSSYLQSMLLRTLNKPLKIDVRNVCEHNVAGPVTRTFSIPRRELINILQQTDKSGTEIMDRVDISEHEDESRWTMYNTSNMDNPSVKPVKDRSTQVQEWELEPQYGDWSAASTAHHGEP